VLQAQHHAQDIGVEGGGIGFGGLFGDRAGLAFGAGVVDGDVQPAKAGDDAVDQGADIVFMADVGGDEGRLGAQAAQLGGQGLALGRPAAGDDDAGAGLGEGCGRGAADAGQAAGHQDNGMGHECLSSGVGPPHLSGMAGRRSMREV
jgi:hypothetical protein